MNDNNDIDRRVTAWLEDGPSRAPERSIDSALAHAQAHPRRRDPLAFIRKDPMNAQTSPIQAAFRPLALVAAMALLLAAAFAVATVGGLFNGRPAVVPPVATPTATASPVATPVPSNLVATPSPTVVHVDLIEHVGADASVDITDRSGTLVGAVSGDPGDGGSVPEGAVEAASPVGDPASVVLTWTGTPCDTTHALTIAPDGVTISITRPACQGDAVPVDHVLKLTFDHPVEFTKVNPTIQTTGN